MLMALIAAFVLTALLYGAWMFWNKNKNADRLDGEGRQNRLNSHPERLSLLDVKPGGKAMQALLQDHLSRFHGDDFKFNFRPESEAKMTIDAIKRSKFFTDGCLKDAPKQTYYHSRGLMPYEDGQYDRDSDDESTKCLARRTSLTRRSCKALSLSASSSLQ